MGRGSAAEGAHQGGKIARCVRAPLLGRELVDLDHEHAAARGQGLTEREGQGAGGRRPTDTALAEDEMESGARGVHGREMPDFSAEAERDA